jgi:predicted GIY-YIG superfamily endonuclease
MTLAQCGHFRHSSTMKGCVDILASPRNGTLYTGVTRDLSAQLFGHQSELPGGFTSRYGVKMLVWFEEHELLTTAITREKTIKNGRGAVETQPDRSDEPRTGGYFIFSAQPMSLLPCRRKAAGFL